MNCLKIFWQYLNQLNHQRLCYRKAGRLARQEQKYQISTLPSPIKPKEIHSVLIINTHTGWGDTLYTNGLLREVKSKTRSLCLATSIDLVDRYRRSPYLDKVYDVFSDNLQDKLPKFDCIIDLNFIAKTKYNFEFMSKVVSWKLTCSDVYKYLNTFQEYIDFSQCAHMSDRYGLITQTLWGKQTKIKPEINLLPVNFEFAQKYLEQIRPSPSVPLFYVNTVGRDKDRCFSRKQIFDILISLEHTQGVIVLYSPEFAVHDIVQEIPSLNHRLVAAPQTDFFNIAAIVKECKAIISPDTSIVHLASAFDIPVLAVFCGNDRDYYGKYFVSEVWSPLSAKSRTLDYSVNNKFFYKSIPIPDLSINLGTEILHFLEHI